MGYLYPKAKKKTPFRGLEIYKGFLTFRTITCVNQVRRFTYALSADIQKTVLQGNVHQSRHIVDI